MLQSANMPANTKPRTAPTKGAGIHVSCLDFGEPEWRAEEYGGENHTDHDRPADEGALDQTGPQDSWVKEEREGAEDQFEEVIVCFTAVEGEEGPSKADFGGWGNSGSAFCKCARLLFNRIRNARGGTLALPMSNIRF